MCKIEEQKDNKQSKTNNYKIQIQSRNLNLKKRKLKSWTAEEDQKLIQFYQQYPAKWGIISSKMKDRNENQCMHRHRRLSLAGKPKKIWSSEQDQTIMKLIQKVGKNWKVISQVLTTKSSKQVRQRFINKLDPKIKNQDWTVQQDHIIIKQYCQLGSRWSQISKKLKGRPQNRVKNRFYSFIQKNYEVKRVEVISDTGNNLASQKQHELNPQLQHRQLRQLAMNSQSQKNSKNSSQNGKQTHKRQKQIISSIKQLQVDLINQKQLVQSSKNIQNRYALQSLIKVDDQLLHASQQNRHRSVKSLHSNNLIQNQNDMFFFTPQMM